MQEDNKPEGLPRVYQLTFDVPTYSLLWGRNGPVLNPGLGKKIFLDPRKKNQARNRRKSFGTFKFPFVKKIDKKWNHNFGQGIVAYDAQEYSEHKENRILYGIYRYEALNANPVFLVGRVKLSEEISLARINDKIRCILNLTHVTDRLKMKEISAESGGRKGYLDPTEGDSLEFENFEGIQVTRALGIYAGACIDLREFFGDSYTGDLELLEIQGDLFLTEKTDDRW